jgi:outer membrane scaffolding protein for murein synthesis (MipA/OmpV family)
VPGAAVAGLSAANSRRLGTLLLAALALPAAITPPAHAELSNETLFGPGLRSRPAYDGAASQRVELVPVLRWFGQPAFLRSTQGVFEGGVRTALAPAGLPGLYGGLQLAYEPARRRSESTWLTAHPVGDLAPGLSGGAQLEWDHALGLLPTTTLLRLRRHSDSRLGSQADLRLSAGLLQHGGLGAGVFAQGIWASGAATRSRYGLDDAQAAAAGLTPYAARGGWLSGSAGLLMGYELARPWLLVGSLEARWLQGDAAHSPLVERRSSLYGSAGVAWRL